MDVTRDRRWPPRRLPQASSQDAYGYSVRGSVYRDCSGASDWATDTPHCPLARASSLDSHLSADPPQYCPILHFPSNTLFGRPRTLSRWVRATAKADGNVPIRRNSARMDSSAGQPVAGSGELESSAHSEQVACLRGVCPRDPVWEVGPPVALPNAAAEAVNLAPRRGLPPLSKLETHPSYPSVSALLTEDVHGTCFPPPHARSSRRLALLCVATPERGCACPAVTAPVVVPLSSFPTPTQQLLGDPAAVCTTRVHCAPPPSPRLRATCADGR